MHGCYCKHYAWRTSRRLFTTNRYDCISFTAISKIAHYIVSVRRELPLSPKFAHTGCNRKQSLRMRLEIGGGNIVSLNFLGHVLCYTNCRDMYLGKAVANWLKTELNTRIKYHIRFTELERQHQQAKCSKHMWNVLSCYFVLNCI